MKAQSVVIEIEKGSDYSSAVWLVLTPLQQMISSGLVLFMSYTYSMH